MVKKTASILLLLVFLFNIMGYYAVFELMRIKIRGEMHERLSSGHEKTELLVIKTDLPSSEFRWIKKKEFLYKGKMYDVEKMTIKGSLLYAWCVHDKKEQSLYAGLKNLHSSQKEFFQSLYQQIIHIAITEHKTVDRFIPTVTKLNFCLLTQRLLNGEKTPVPHPPELIFS